MIPRMDEAVRPWWRDPYGGLSPTATVLAAVATGVVFYGVALPVLLYFMPRLLGPWWHWWLD